MKNKYIKRLGILVLIILIIVGIGRVLKLKGYIPKYPVYASLIKMGVINYCYTALTDMIDIFNQEGFNYELENEKVIKNSLSKLADINSDTLELPKIPTITHKIYFTSTDSTTTLNDFYVEELKLNYTNLNSLNTTWKHIIWTNNPRIFPQEVINIQNVEVRNVEEFNYHPAYHDLKDLLEKGNKQKPYFAQASDLLRLVALQKYGGIYSDLDYEIYNVSPLYNLLKKFDFIAGREIPDRYSFYGNAFLAAKPNHPIINDALLRSVRNYNIDPKDSSVPQYLKFPCNNYDKLYFNGPLLITLSYFSKNNTDGNNDIILPPWIIFNLNFARLKNNTGLTDLKKQECVYSEITKANFEENSKNLPEMLKTYIDNITFKDWQKYYDFKVLGLEDSNYYDYENNIYYKLDDRRNYPVIGADMFCGSWTFGGKVFKRKYYWTWEK